MTTEPARDTALPSARSTARRPPPWLLLVAGVAVLFGVATVVAGGRVLFGPPAVRAAEGDYVPFVLWFNFLAGFLYVVAGVAIGLARPWAARLALGIAAATALVYAAFGIHVLIGGAHTMRTVQAMALRTAVWTVIAVLTCRRSGCRRSVRGPGAAVGRAAAPPAATER